jgi:hypothetical protein
VWLMQSASASVDGLAPSAIISALGAVVAVLARGWQQRLKNSEAAERERTAELIKSLTDRAERAEARVTYLEDQRGHLATKLLEARLQVREQQRSQSPPPSTGYSMQTSATKTRPSRG